MIRTYRYRLHPTNAQARTLDFLLWQGRTVYNAALEQRITVYREAGESVTCPQQWAHFRALRNANPDTLGQLNATSMQQVLRRLDKAFFRLEYRYGDGCKLRLDDRGRALFYAGEVKVKYHRPLPDDATLKHIIIKRRNRKWYVCLQAERPDPATRNVLVLAVASARTGPSGANVAGCGERSLRSSLP